MSAFFMPNHDATIVSNTGQFNIRGSSLRPDIAKAYGQTTILPESEDRICGYLAKLFRVPALSNRSIPLRCV